MISPEFKCWYFSLSSYDPDYGYDEFGPGGRDSGYSTHGQEFSYDTTGPGTDPLAGTPAGHRSDRSQILIDFFKNFLSFMGYTLSPLS